MSEDQTSEPTLYENIPIAEKLINMGLKDQEMRIGHQVEKSSFDSNIDKENQSGLKLIVEKKGWPTISEFGPVASHAAWLIVQHADLDVEFQEKCLKLMQSLDKKEIDQTYIAYLTDRVMVNKNKKQIYGTQFYRTRKGQIVPRPIKDLSSLSDRREQMGLEPFEIYRKRMEGNYIYPEGYENPKVGSFYKQS